MLWAHVALAIVWTLVMVPTLLFWPSSVLFLSFVSVYTVVEGHVIAITVLRRERKRNS